MTIAKGDSIPDVPVRILVDGAQSVVSSAELLGKGRVVLFAVPGAFTPGCSRVHLPGYAAHAATLAEKGVDQVACISVNDAFVMDAWGRTHDVSETITMIADPAAEWATAVGLDVDASGAGLGIRSQRYALVIDNGVVQEVLLEDDGFSVSNSTAECVLQLV